MCLNKCEKPILHQYSCHNLTCTCKHCVASAIDQKASRIERRHKMMNRLYYSTGINMGALKHIVLSPDDPPTIEEFMSDRGESFRTTATALIRDHSKDGFYAGTTFVHPFRYEHVDGSCCEDPECEEEHFYIYSPHVHYLGHCFLERSDSFHDQTGWIYKNIDPGSRRSLFATVRYELSHVGVFMKEEPVELDQHLTGEMMWHVIGTVYSHIGKYSNSCGGGERLSSQQVESRCPKCQSILFEVVVSSQPGHDRNGAVDPNVQDLTIEENHVIGPHLVWEITERWHLNVLQYQDHLEDGEIVRNRIPCKRIYLDETFKTDDKGLVIEN